VRAVIYADPDRQAQRRRSAGWLADVLARINDHNFQTARPAIALELESGRSKARRLT
jgi:hypothetical protein